jgi:hypothetical protein
MVGWVDLSIHLYHAKLLFGAKIIMEGDQPCSESLDNAFCILNLSVYLGSFRAYFFKNQHCVPTLKKNCCAQLSHSPNW